MPQCLMDGQEPYEGSGFLVDDIESVEITLCSEPAVKGAGFRMMRSAGKSGEGVGGDRDRAVMNFYRKLSGSRGGSRSRRGRNEKRQVLGYATVPWIEDWYGDVLDPDSVSRAAHSFLKNLSNGRVIGNGVGEEHMRFWDNAYVIESSIDSKGAMGIPGGWWIGLQITSPEVWEKVASGEYTGFSLGSEVVYTNTRSEEFGRSVYEMMPILGTEREPAVGKSGAVNGDREVLTWAGYPIDENSYADRKNFKFPIDTRSRAYACLRYILRHWKEDRLDDEYSLEEMSYMVRRALGAIAVAGDTIPAAVLEKAGFGSSGSSNSNSSSSSSSSSSSDGGMDSVIEFAKTSGIKCQSIVRQQQAASSSSARVGGGGARAADGSSVSFSFGSSGSGNNNNYNHPTREEDAKMTLDELFAQMKEQSEAQNKLLLSIATKLDSLGAGAGAGGTADGGLGQKTASSGAEDDKDKDKDNKDAKKGSADDDKKGSADDDKKGGDGAASDGSADDDKDKDKDNKDAKKGSADDGADSSKKEQSVQALAQAISAALMAGGEQKKTASASAGAGTGAGSMSADDMQRVLASFGEQIVNTLGASQRNTTEILQNIAERIAEMPVPRATMNRSMSRDQKSAFLADMKRKIEGGLDISRAEMELAAGMGVDFSKDDPMQGVAF